MSARPRFLGHYQPHIPADLGFYDLRLEEVRIAQAKLAAEYGIYGFCYYHYWFNGRRVLERPVDDILKSQVPDFPFMLCWANENWTRSWDGSQHSVLLRQNYSDDDHRRHAEHLMAYFTDTRYIRIDGKPVFAVYKDSEIPDTNRMCDIFQNVASENGMELYLCRFERRIGTRPQEPLELGFNAGIEFQPLSKSYNHFVESRHSTLKQLAEKAIRRVFGQRLAHLRNRQLLSKIFRPDEFINYEDFVDHDIDQKTADYLCYPGVCPGWDNSPRRTKSGATIFWGSTPELFEKWVRGKVANFIPPSKEEDLLFINAWNEWAEGNHLEPCIKYGHQYLQAFHQGVELGLEGRVVDKNREAL